MEDDVARRLTAIGYTVTRMHFSAAPSRLGAGAAAGAGVGWIALLLTPLLVFPFAATAVVAIGVGLIGFLALVTYGLAHGYLPSTRAAVQATNLEARRGTPRFWLVAHLDSKSQRVSLGTRALAVGLTLAALAGLVGLLAIRLAGPVPWFPVIAVLIVALVGGGVLASGRVDNASPGAVDNASGIIAALVAAEALRSREDVGVLLTGAEEFGMVGARAWVHEPGRASGLAFVNFDGIDSRGSYRVMPHADRDLARLIAQALRDNGAAVAVGRLPVGVWVDGGVLHAAGFRGATLSRGDFRTLGIVHTRRDGPGRMDVDAAVRAGRAVARVVRDRLG